MNELQIFNNEEFGEVRTIEIDGEPWFIASDICKALEISNTTVAMDRLDEDEKSKFNLGLSGGDINCVNEYGLYALVLASRKGSAKRFKRWITHDVIPQIRKTGGYNLPQTYAEALRALADKAEQAERLKIENTEMKPKAEFFDAVADSRDAISLAEAAKVLDLGIGRNKLFEFLRKEKILQRDNQPYQKYVDLGYFRVIEQKYTVGDEVRINIKTLVYQKGLDFIRKKYSERNYVDPLSVFGGYDE